MASPTRTQIKDYSYWGLVLRTIEAHSDLSFGLGVQGLGFIGLRVEDLGFSWGCGGNFQGSVSTEPPMHIVVSGLMLLIKEILHPLGAMNYCNSWDFKDLKWCKNSSINRVIRRF